MRATMIEEPARQVPLYGEYEVVLLGGGPAGIVAAASAARAGRKTLLIERYGFLGGMGTAAGVTNFAACMAMSTAGPSPRAGHGVRAAGADRSAQWPEHAASDPRQGLCPAYDTAAYKIAADQLLASHKVHILFHALGAGVVMGDNSRIDALMVETKAGRRAVRSEIFIDCSGDGDLAVWAGAPFDIGDAHGHPMYPSMMLRLNGIDPDKAGDARRTIPHLMEKALAAGTHTFPRKSAIVRPQKSGIEWRVNFTQVAREDGHAINGVEPDDLSRGEIEGRKQALAAFEFLRTVPGFEKSYIVDLPPQLGIRETRRIKGGYQLSGEDVLGCASFEDPLASMAGRSRLTFPATSSSLFHRSRSPAAITSCRIGCWCPKVSTICWSPAVAPR